MSDLLDDLTAFSFRRRALPVPGDLRIGWRIALILLMVGNSKSGRASVAKLHVLNDAIRTGRGPQLLGVVTGVSHISNWMFRVEPAFARAVDFCAGEGFIRWSKIGARTALEISDSGLTTMKYIISDKAIFSDERDVVIKLTKLLSEAKLNAILEKPRK